MSYRITSVVGVQIWDVDAIPSIIIITKSFIFSPRSKRTRCMAIRFDPMQFVYCIGLAITNAQRWESLYTSYLSVDTCQLMPFQLIQFQLKRTASQGASHCPHTQHRDDWLNSFRTCIYLFNFFLHLFFVLIELNSKIEEKKNERRRYEK